MLCTPCYVIRTMCCVVRTRRRWFWHTSFTSRRFEREFTTNLKSDLTVRKAWRKAERRTPSARRSKLCFASEQNLTRNQSHHVFLRAPQGALFISSVLSSSCPLLLQVVATMSCPAIPSSEAGQMPLVL